MSLLLVDDNPGFLCTLRCFLEVQGKGAVRVVGTAGSGFEALILALLRRPEVVVLDPAVPDLQALALFLRLRHLLPEVGIIALSLPSPVASRAAADAFVAKSRLERDLLPAIHQVARR